MTEQFKPDLVINGVLIRRLYSDYGVCWHYALRAKVGDRWCDRIVSAGPMPITSRHQPMPSRLDDVEEIALLTRAINGEEID